MFGQSLQDKEFVIPSIQKENAFNAIRLLFCIVVIFMHCLNKCNIENRYLLDGHVAVCGFFIISGFWVSKSYFSSKDIKDFFIKRAKKILPMYYIAVVGFSLICAVFSNLQLKDFFGIDYLKYLFWNGMFLNFKHPSLPGCFNGEAINGALWTIKIEIGFYIILPVILYFWRRIKLNRSKNIYLATLYLLSILYNSILKRYSNQWHLPGQLEHQLPGFVSFFISGMLVLFNWKTFIQFKNWLIIPSITVYILHYFTNTEYVFPLALAIIIVYFSLLLKFLNRIGKDIDFSWGMYLFHFPLMQILYFNGRQYINVPIYISSVIGIAFMLTFIVEKYIQKRIK
jgi:peptidoglycan/LPS O-acetylase OafA/YrhL